MKINILLFEEREREREREREIETRDEGRIEAAISPESS